MKLIKVNITWKLLMRGLNSVKENKTIIIAILLTSFALSTPVFALTEEEEFKLYKEFKKYKETAQEAPNEKIENSESVNSTDSKNEQLQRKRKYWAESMKQTAEQTWSKRATDTSRGNDLKKTSQEVSNTKKEKFGHFELGLSYLHESKIHEDIKLNNGLGVVAGYNINIPIKNKFITLSGGPMINYQSSRKRQDATDIKMEFIAIGAQVKCQLPVLTNRVYFKLGGGYNSALIEGLDQFASSKSNGFGNTTSIQNQINNIENSYNAFKQTPFGSNLSPASVSNQVSSSYKSGQVFFFASGFSITKYLNVELQINYQTAMYKYQAKRTLAAWDSADSGISAGTFIYNGTIIPQYKTDGEVVTLLNEEKDIKNMGAQVTVMYRF